MNIRKAIIFIINYIILGFKSVHETVDTINEQNYTDSNILCMG